MKTNNSTVIIGLGKTGFSCAQFLSKKNQDIVVMDDRDQPPYLEKFKESLPHQQVILGRYEPSTLEQAQEVIVSPGVAVSNPIFDICRKKNINIIGDIEVFARECTAPIIAITGSNGKSTVTSIVGELATQSGINAVIGGNIGTPVLELIDKKAALYILELSSFQLETTFSLKPSVATILNISPDHMDRYNTLDDYTVAKQRIYQGCQTAVWNRADSKTKPIESIKNLQSFGLDYPRENEFGLIENFLALGGKKLMGCSEVNIKGKHNIANVLAALALGHAQHFPMQSMLDSLRTFKGLKHRTELVIKHNTIEWINDSKGTNVGSTLAAIEGIGSNLMGKIIWIGGGIGKGADFKPLQQAVSKYVRHTILFGQDAKLIANSIKTLPHQLVTSLKEAVEQAEQHAMPGDIVLFSPACSSFDMFNNFEDRGEKFCELVHEVCKD